MLSVIYAECCYAECRGAIFDILDKQFFPDET